MGPSNNLSVKRNAICGTMMIYSQLGAADRGKVKVEYIHPILGPRKFMKISYRLLIFSRSLGTQCLKSGITLSLPHNA